VNPTKASQVIEMPIPLPLLGRSDIPQVFKVDDIFT
jgi:hypothetical protein